MIAFYGRTLEVRAALPDHHAAGRAGHAGADHLPLHRHPQGILPGAGYRRHPGHFAGARRPSPSTAMAQKQQELAKVILQDPAVESLSSFIGADGTNTTLNSGRMSINLKPLDQRDLSASDVIRRLQSKPATGAGHPPLSCSRCRTSRSMTASAARSTSTRSKIRITNELNQLDRTASSTKLKQLPELEDVATDQQTGGLRRVAGHRPRHRLAAGHRPDHDRQHALRRLRPAPDQHDVHAAQPVPRDPGSAAAVPARPETAEPALHPGQRLRRAPAARRPALPSPPPAPLGRLQRH